MKDLFKKMETAFPADVMSILEKVGALAGSLNYRAFLVGGVVRDLIIGNRNLDLDIAIEGDAIRLGREIAGEIGASIVAHKKFGTCTLSAGEGLKIDFATARKEVYRKPGAMPDVQPSSLEDDLRRRDFTINAMAISLNNPDFGRLVDFFDGVRDLKAGRVRVIHNKSFIDDPTRIFRAIRFEARFGFKIEDNTETLIKDAVRLGSLNKVSGGRIRKEILLIQKEPHPRQALKRMDDILKWR